MNIIHKGRLQGKTYDAIVLSSRTRGIILCENEARRNNIITMAQKNNLSIPIPLIFNDTLSYNLSYVDIIIDQGDEFLEYITKANIIAITVNDKSFVPDFEKHTDNNSSIKFEHKGKTYTKEELDEILDWYAR